MHHRNPLKAKNHKISRRKYRRVSLGFGISKSIGKQTTESSNYLFYDCYIRIHQNKIVLLIHNTFKKSMTSQTGRKHLQNISEKELVCRINKEPLLQLNNEKMIQISKQAKHLDRNFTKEDIQMTQNHMRKCSTASVITEI